MAEIGRELDAASGNADETATPPPQPGTPVNVEIKKRYITTENPTENSGLYGRELRELAANEMDRTPTEDLPIDPLIAFLEEWGNYANGQFNCLVYRLPDSGPRRMPGSTYRRPYFGPAPEMLGTMSFDSNIGTFTANLQALNQYSGGSFQVYLIDVYGRRVQDAVLWTCTIADPASVPGQQQQQQTGQSQYIEQRPPHREESEEDRQLKALRNQLLQASIDRMLNPPAPPPPASSLSPEDQAQLYLLRQAPSLLPNMFGQMAELQRGLIDAASNSAKEPTMKDRLIDAGLELATKNPAIVDRISSTLERIINRLLPPPTETAAPPPPAVHYLPQQQTAPQPPPPPRTPVTDTANEDGEEDEEIMIILDELLKLLNSRKELTANDPVLIALYQRYPLKFRAAASLIASQSLDDIIAWVCAQDSMFDNLLTSEVSGPYLRQRIAQLQIVFQQAGKQQQQAKDEPTEDNNSDVE
jgi:hypothetical protein